MSRPPLEQHWTRALLDAGAADIVAWEIDPSLPPVEDPRAQWRLGDILSLRAEDLAGKALAAFAPYETLDHIESIIGRAGDAVALVPEKKMARWLSLGFRVIARLESDDFEPPSEGGHLVVARGFLRPFSPAKNA